MDAESYRLQFSPKFGGAIELLIVDPVLADRLRRREDLFHGSDTETLNGGSSHSTNSSLLEGIHYWWESRISVILPQGADLRDHFGECFEQICRPFRPLLLKKLRLTVWHNRQRWNVPSSATLEPHLLWHHARWSSHNAFPSHWAPLTPWRPMRYAFNTSAGH